MMKKEIKFSLVYRDMWQSSGKYQPRVDQLVRIAPLIVEMGCFARVETNGGAFEQVNLLYGENPNKAVRAFTALFQRSRHTDAYARPRAECTAHVSCSGGCTPIDVQSEACPRRGHHPYLLRTERDAEYNSLHQVCSGSRHDTAGHTLYHLFSRPYGRVLRRHCRPAD